MRCEKLTRKRHSPNFGLYLQTYFKIVFSDQFYFVLCFASIDFNQQFRFHCVKEMNNGNASQMNSSVHKHCQNKMSNFPFVFPFSALKSDLESLRCLYFVSSQQVKLYISIFKCILILI